MPDTSRISKGRRGENIAAEYLVRQGFVLLERNYRRLGCEVDIIAMDGETTVFIEVKARSSRNMGLGREAVTYAKQRNIIKDAPVRFDVAEVDLVECGVEYIKNAFQA